MSRLARLLAVVGPALVILAWAAWAGFLTRSAIVVRPTLSKQTRTILEQVLPRDPPVIVLGNSQAECAVDRAMLGDALGVGPSGVAAITVGGSHAAFAYALLARWVVEAHPKLILLPMSLDHLLDTTPPDGAQRGFIDEVRDTDLPAFDAKVLGSTWPRWDAAHVRAQAIRDEALETLTALPLRWAGDPDPAARMDHARDAVFGELGGAQFVQDAHVIPVVERDSPTAPATVDLDRTLLPDILALAQSHGVQLVLTTVPQQVRHLETSPAMLQQIASYAHDHGAGFAHLEPVPIPDGGWVDFAHLNPNGSAIFTTALIASLDAMGAMQPGALKLLPLPIAAPLGERVGPSTSPVPQSISGDHCLYRVKLKLPGGLNDIVMSSHGLGNASPLTVSLHGTPLTPHSALGPDAGCVGGFSVSTEFVLVSPPTPGPVTLADLSFGWTTDSPHTRRAFAKDPTSDTRDVWWLPSGGALTLHWPDALDIAGPDAHLRILLSALDDAPGAPTLSIDGKTVEVKSWGRLFYADVAIAPGKWSPTIHLSSPAGAPELFIRRLVLRDRNMDQMVIGSASDRIDRLDLVPGVLADVAPGPPQGIVSAHGTRVGSSIRFEVPPPAGVLFDELMAWHGDDAFFLLCYPFDIVPDTEEFRRTTYHMLKPGVMSVAVGPQRSPEPDWQLTWRPDRTCKRHAWIHPGETVTVDARTTGLLHITADEVAVELVDVSGTGPVHLTLQSDDHVLVDQGLDAATLGNDPIVLPLSQPLDAWPGKVRLTVTAPPGAMLLLGPTELRAASPPADAWFAQRPAHVPRTPRPIASSSPPTASEIATPLPDQATRAMTAGEILRRQADLSTTLDGFHAVPADRTHLSYVDDDGAPELRVEAQAGFACFPDVPTTGQVLARAQVRSEGKVVARTLALDVRWMDDKDRPIKDAAGAPLGATTALSNVDTQWHDVQVVAPLPPPNAAAARVCVRRLGEPGVFRVRAWELARALPP